MGDPERKCTTSNEATIPHITYVFYREVLGDAFQSHFELEVEFSCEEMMTLEEVYELIYNKNSVIFQLSANGSTFEKQLTTDTPLPWKHSLQNRTEALVGIAATFGTIEQGLLYYQGLDLSIYTEADRSKLEERRAIFERLFGLLRPFVATDDTEETVS